MGVRESGGMAYAADLGSAGATRVGSNPTSRTIGGPGGGAGRRPHLPPPTLTTVTERGPEMLRKL